MRTVHDAARDRHPVTWAEHERLAPLYRTDYTVIHGRERLVEAWVVRGAFGGQVDVC
jgi:hypothetical protein